MGWEFRPIAICVDCERPISADNDELINEHCARRASGRQCRGFYSSTMDPNDWRRCGLCGGSGHRNDAPCDFCHGTGWDYVGTK